MPEPLDVRPSEEVSPACVEDIVVLRPFLGRVPRTPLGLSNFGGCEQTFTIEFVGYGAIEKPPPLRVCRRQALRKTLAEKKSYLSARFKIVHNFLDFYRFLPIIKMSGAKAPVD
ncbi:MAG: hypothetical protein MdMp014T_0204 [Treponematales bacterium]